MNTQDERKKVIKIDWLEECPKCTRKTVEVTTIKGSKELLFDGDKVKCWCGQTGEIETNNGEAWVEWDEVVISDKDNHDTYYRSKYPDFWDRLPACNHQAWEHYEVSLHAWLVALKQNKEKLEGCVVVPEWISIKDQLPTDGQKCLVVFEVMHSADDANRYMEIDTFNDGYFDSIIEYEDQASTVALPAGSTISKIRAVCWVPTGLSNKPLTFDQFYEEAERGGNE